MPVRPRPSASVPPDPASQDAALADGLRALGLSPGPEVERRLLEYLAMLAKWNAVYNLTAIRDPAAMLVHHLFDCLAIVPTLRERGLLPEGATVVDVGSGGGLPGVVIAILEPGVQVHCVDTVGKKAAFVAQVRAELGLPNLYAHHARIENLRVPRDLPRASLIVSRAFSSLAQFMNASTHLLGKGGSWAAMKGQLPEGELAELPRTAELRATIKLAVPMLDAQRHLLILQARG